MKNENTTWQCNSRPQNIDLARFDHDEKVDEIDRILKLLIESRYGSGAIYQPLEIRWFLPQINTVNFDLMPRGFAPTFSNYCFSVLGINQTSKAANDIGLKSTAALAAFPAHAHSPSTLARGSPYHRRPYVDL